jgi:RNA recognition motif-containing protein
MALFKSRNQMGANKNNNQAQMLMLLNQVTNLENQLRMGSVPQNQNTGMDSSNLLNIVSQLKSIQGNLPGSSKRNGIPKAPVMPLTNPAASLAGLLQSISGGNGIMDRSPCVWVTGLPEEYQDADKLFNIFGNFGNVIRIKFTEKKPDGALIEMDDPRGAFKCIMSLNKKKLGGQEISVAGTKIEANTAYIKKGDTKSKDFRRAKENWRFSSKDKDGKFRKIVCSRLKNLSPKLIVSNLPDGKSDALKKYIIEAGYTVKSIEGSQRPEDKEKKNTGYTMAVVELASVEEAIGAVAYLHNTWPAKFGTKKEDKFGNARGLVFSLAGTIPEKPKADNVQKQN